MENFDLLMEKYKKEMLSLAERASAETAQELSESPVETDGRRNASASHTEDTPKPGKAVGTEIHKEYKGKGSLKIKVFTGNEAFPVMSALVQVFDGDDMVAEEYTNQNGTAKELFLPAPGRDLSRSPGNEQGYAMYAVTVSHPGFNRVILNNVPVFDSIQSLQPVPMEPLNLRGETVIDENGVGEGGEENV